MTAWLAEDCPSFDWGGFVVGEGVRTAHLNAKATGILAGVPFFDEVFHQLNCSVQWHYREGQWIDVHKDGKGKGKVVVATVQGPVRKLLLGERVALNTLARCSGIATASARFLEKARKAGFQGIVAGTRKTTPGRSICAAQMNRAGAVTDGFYFRLSVGGEVWHAGRRSGHAPQRPE